MRILPRLCLLVVFSGEGMCFLSHPERDIVLHLVRKTRAKRVILAPNEEPSLETGTIVKELSKGDVASVFVRRDNLREYLKCPDFRVLSWTVIVLKESELSSADYLDDLSILPSFFWLLFDSSNGTLRQELTNIYIPSNTALLLIENPNPGHYVVDEYYKIKKCSPGVFTAYARWNNGQFKLLSLEWYDRKSNFRGHELTTVKFKQNLYLNPKEEVNEAIWKELSLLLNFTIRERLIDFSPTNTQVDLIRGEDEALLDTAIYIGNSQEYRYMLGPTSQSRIYMHVKAEGEYKALSRFLMPLNAYTWHSLGIWLCYCALFEFVIEYLSRKFKCSDKPLKESYAVAMLPLDSLCNQCGEEISDNCASRVVHLFIRSSACVIYHAYGATLITYLLVSIPRLPFVDLKGFVEDGTYKMIAERNSDVDVYFNVSAVPLERLIYSKFLVDVREWDRLDREIDRMCRGEKLVLVAFDNDIDKYQPCHIVKIRKPLNVVANGFKLKFLSPFKGLLHVKLALLRSSGVLQKLNKLILPKHKNRHQTSVHNKVDMERISSAFVFLFVGQISAIIILRIEIAIVKYKNPQQRYPYLE